MIYRNVEFPFQVSWGEVQRNIFYGLHFSSLLLSRIVRLSQEGWNSFSARLEAFGSTLPIQTNPFWPKNNIRRKTCRKRYLFKWKIPKWSTWKRQFLTNTIQHPWTNCFDVLVGMLLTLVVEQGIQPVVFLVCFMRARVRHDVECIKKVGEKDASGIENWVIPQIHEFPAVSSGIFVREMFMKCSIKHIRFLGAILFKHTFHSNPERTPKETQWLVDCRRQRILPLFHSNYEFAP